MLAECVPSVMLRVPLEVVPENVGCCRDAKLMSDRSSVSCEFMPATVPEKLDELSSFSVPVEPLKVTGAESAAASSSVAPAPIVADPDAPARGLLICRVVLGAA